MDLQPGRQQILQMIRDQKAGLDYEAADSLARSKGSRLARNREFDLFFSKVPPVPLTLGKNALTETFVAYPKPNKPFGESMERVDPRTKLRYYLDTRSFKGESGIAIWFDGCDFVPDKETRILVPRGEVKPHPDFPQECGDFAFSEVNGIPIFDGTESRPGYPETRHLTREMENDWFGPAIRAYSRIQTFGNYMDQDIYLMFYMSSAFAVFIPDPGMQPPKEPLPATSGHASL